MPDPHDTDDDWADLAREFALDKPAAPPPDMVERHVEEEAVEPHHGSDPRLEDAAVADGETEAEAAEEEFDDADEAGAEAPAEGEQPGTGRKRRRRRRRRRKGGQAAEAAATPADAEPEAEAESEPELIEVAEDAPDAEPEAYTEDEAEDADAMPLAAEEDTASEVLRELIATWNVPSWDEIVDGLYRPH
jgi:ribonuclease E